MNNAALLASQAPGAGNALDGKWYSGDSVSIAGTPVGTFNSANVLSASTVTYSGLSLTGAQAGNYSLTVQSPTAAAITPKTVSLTASKTYDGSVDLGSAQLTLGSLVTG